MVYKKGLHEKESLFSWQFKKAQEKKSKRN